MNRFWICKWKVIGAITWNSLWCIGFGICERMLILFTFFFECAGELRINILRRKKGERSLKCYRYDGSVTHPKNKITTLTRRRRTRPVTLDQTL